MAHVGDLRSDLRHPVASFEPLVFASKVRKFGKSDGHRFELFFARPVILNSSTQEIPWYRVSTSMILTTILMISKLAALFVVVPLPHYVHHVGLQVDMGIRLQVGFQTWIALVDEDGDLHC